MVGISFIINHLHSSYLHKPTNSIPNPHKTQPFCQFLNINTYLHLLRDGTKCRGGFLRVSFRSFQKFGRFFERFFVLWQPGVQSHTLECWKSILVIRGSDIISKTIPKSFLNHSWTIYLPCNILYHIFVLNSPHWGVVQRSWTGVDFSVYPSEVFKTSEGFSRGSSFFDNREF
jgi:hypothetical protein